MKSSQHFGGLMKTTRIVLLFFIMQLMLGSVSVFAELSDAAKEAIENAKKERETEQKKKEEQKAKEDSIPKKLVFFGILDKMFPGDKNSHTESHDTIIFKLNNGQIISVKAAGFYQNRKDKTKLEYLLQTGQKIFTRTLSGDRVYRSDCALPLEMIGKKVAIISPLSGILPGDATVCQISKDSQIYCGDEVENLSKYYTTKELIYPTKSKLENIPLQKDEQQSKTNISTSIKEYNIPGKLVFIGIIDKVENSVTIKLLNGQKLIIPSNSNFIVNKAITPLWSLYTGMEVAIVNPSLSSASHSPDREACVITSESKIYCGDIVEALKHNYPTKK